jgi:type IX secretion system PorP/SprF family membrane protein
MNFIYPNYQSQHHLNMDTGNVLESSASMSVAAAISGASATLADEPELKKVKPEITAGLWLYAPNYFFGMSVANIIPGKNSFVINSNYGDYFTPNYFITGGYRCNLTEDINFIPSLMYQYWRPQLSGLHVNTKFQYRDLMWMGTSYRFSNLISGYAAFLGMNVGNTLNASYSYEVATTSRLRNYTGNTHEIQIGFIIGNKFGDGCPRIQL